jgi:CDP-diacylglycerol--glycerol-3-phosphate 3-phosphatidyltransferase
MLRKGITMGARMGGKIKTVAYILAGGAALLALSMERLGLEAPLRALRTAALVIFIISVVFSILSFFDYVKVYRAAKS